MVKDKLLKKNFIWNIIGSTFSSCLSLFFLIIVTRINGIEEAGIFTFAFSTACLFYIIGIYSGRVYQVTDNDKNLSDCDYIFSRVFSCILMILFALIFCIVQKYDTHKFLIIIGLVLFKVCEAFSESLYAIIQEKNQLYKVGKSLLLKALFCLLFFIIIDYITKNLIISILSLIIINMIFILIYDFRNIKMLGFHLDKINFGNILIILKRGFCAFAFAFLTQYVINAPRYAIDGNLSNEIQTIFGILIMPATVLVLLGQFLIHPFLIRLKEYWNNDKSAFLGMTLKLSGSILITGICAVIGAYYLGIPVLSLFYNINLNDYLLELIIIIIGATFYEISVIFSTSLTTMRYTFCQLIIFSIVSLIGYLLSNYFVI